MKKNKLIYMVFLTMLITQCANETQDPDPVDTKTGTPQSGPVQIRIKNTTGGTLSFTFHTVTDCSDTAVVSYAGVATNTTTLFQEITSGDYYVNAGGNCIPAVNTYSANTHYTCIAELSGFNCAGIDSATIKVAVKNNYGTVPSLDFYLHKTSDCSDSASATFIDVAVASTTAYQQIAAGDYYEKEGLTPVCSSGPTTFLPGRTYVCRYVSSTGATCTDTP